MKRYKTIVTRFACCFFLAFVAFSAPAQESYKLDNLEITLEGTSSLHDWECDVNDVTVKSEFTSDEDRLVGIDLLEVLIRSQSIKSDKKAMDKKMHEALKADRFPSISFKMIELLEFDENKLVVLSGDLTIAGVTKEIRLSAQAKFTKNGLVTFSGKNTILMTDYGIVPPVALFGTLKTGDEIKLNYRATFNKQSREANTMLNNK